MMTLFRYISFIVFLFVSNQSIAQYQHLLPESEYPYWPEYNYLGTDDLHAVDAQEWINNKHVINGWDWSLPEFVEPSPRGLVGLQRNIGWDKDFINMNLQFKSNGVGILWVKWRDIEKTEGDIDFSPVISRIEQASSIGLDVVLRILCHSKSRDGDINKGEAPLWLEDLGAVLSEPTNHNHNFYPGHPVFHKQYLELVDALAETDIPQLVKAAYVGYASPAFGDEGIGPYGENNHEANDTVKHVRERLDAWQNAFEGMEYKIFMGGAVDYGFKKGFGVRRGFVEMYWYHIPDELMGQVVDADGYLYVDESAPIIDYECFNGEVNEEYEAAWATPSRDYRFGETTNSFPYRYFMSSLRALQMRCTYIHTTGHLLPEMLPFIGQQLGRTVEDTPDAWSFLVTSHLKSGETRNWERWLFQRDAPGYETSPAVKMQHVRKMWMIEDNKYYDYIARKGKKMGFNVDDRLFPGGEQKMAIKVSFHDAVQGKLKLLYQSNDGIKSDSIETTGEDKIRTVSFFVEARMDDTDFEHEFDFVLESEEEVPVSIVRVIKTEERYNDTDQSPYGGNIYSIPGIIEGEHYDEGGEGSAYHDTNMKKGDTTFRPDDLVDVVLKAGAKNDYVVGFTEEGEWLEYSVMVETGRYDITLHYYCGSDPGELSVKLGDNEIATFSGMENKGWDAANTITVEEVSVLGGDVQILVLEFVNGAGFDIDAVEFTKREVPVESVSISACPSSQFWLGDSLQLLAELAPFDASDQTTSWSSSNPAIATVDNNGWVKTHAGGSTMIRVSSNNGNLSDSCLIEVFDPNAGQLPFHGENWQIPGRIEAEEYDLGGEGIAYHDDNEKGGVMNFRPDDNVDIRSVDSLFVVTKTENDEWLEYSVNVEEGYYDISMHYISAWPQDCEVIISLDDQELVRFSNLEKTPDWDTFTSEKQEFVQISGGDNKILRLTISETSGNVQIDALDFVKIEIVDITGVSITACPSTELVAGDEHKLTAEITPADATFTGVEWISSNTDVATVDEDGLVNALAEGEAVVTVTSDDGSYTAECVLTISRAPIHVSGVTINNCPSLDMVIDDTHELEAVITPANADDTGFSWSSQDESILTVDNNGLLTALAEGTVNIILTSNDGGFTDECQVNVKKAVVPVTGVSIGDCPADTILIDSVHQLTALVSPEDADEQRVTWSSSDEAIAAVDESGKITGLAAGEVTILVSSTDGGFTDECTFVVDKGSATLQLAESIQMVTVYPNPAKDELHIDFNKLTAEKSVKVYNSYGQLLYSESSNASKLKIDLTGFVKGESLLLVNINSENKSATFKVQLTD